MNEPLKKSQQMIHPLTERQVQTNTMIDRRTRCKTNYESPGEPHCFPAVARQTLRAGCPNPAVNMYGCRPQPVVTLNSSDLASSSEC